MAWMGRHFFTMDGYYRIIEGLGLEGTPRITMFQPPCSWQGCQPLGQVLDQIAHGPTNLALSTFRDGASSSFRTSRSFSAGLLSRNSPSLYRYLRLSQPKCKTLHLALLNLIRFTWAHLSSSSKSQRIPWTTEWKQKKTENVKARYEKRWGAFPSRFTLHRSMAWV